MDGEAWTAAFIGLGSNLDDPGKRLVEAAQRISELPRTRWQSASSVYRSAPLGPVDQPDFCNAVAALLTRLDAHALLRALFGIERAMGRQRAGPRWGPRRIDLDLLLHGDSVHSDEELTLPHPGLSGRVFVVCPLAEIAPRWRLPDGTQVVTLAREFDCTQLTRIGELGIS